MTKDELIEETNRAITELVYPKYELKKAYNYYNGKRDPELFRYLEENFGIGSPTSVEFIPLIKKHVDALVGEYLGTPILPKVSCKDTNTINNINREKLIKITEEVYKYLLKQLKNQILLYITKNKMDDISIELLLQKLIDDLNTNFVSEYEIAALNVVEYIMQSRDTDMLTKLKLLLVDILVTGYCFYKVHPSTSGTNIKIDVYSPLNVFIDRNPDSPYVKDSYRAVVRHWYTKSLILNKYGKDLSKEDIKKIKDNWKNITDLYGSYYVRNIENHGIHNDGIFANLDIEPGFPEYNEIHNWREKLIPVYEVEWVDTDSDFVMQHYETIRIGEEIYILKGKDTSIIRTLNDPTHCTLKLNGVFFTNRSGHPYSMVIACMPLLDKYDCLHYFRDNLLASSGSVGDIIDVSLLPNWLGTEPIERIKKFLAYKKTGAAIIDTAQPGRAEVGAAAASYQTMFNGYDDTIKAPAIQAILLAIDSVELTCSSITGVFRERLNGIEARDAVTNIKMGLNNSFIITKQYYQLMDLVVVEMLTDGLNCAKIVYSNGLTGTLILGEKYLKIFTALPQYFTVTDYDIRVVTSTDVIKDMEYIKLIVPDFIKSLAFTPDIIFEALTTKSLTDLKQKVLLAMKKLKEENNQLLQLQQLGELLQQQLQQAQLLLQQAQLLIQSLNQEKIKLETEKINMQYKIDSYNAKTERDYKISLAENDTKRTEIELLLLKDGNPYNDEVKNE